jgi:multicomponent Na+:H+ antiporter subunit C
MIMTETTLFGLCAAALVGLGLFGIIVNPQPLRKVVAFNVLGGGVFMLFGVVARRAAAMGFGGDPVPQGLVITGLVVSFAATALAVALILRLHAVAGTASLRADALDATPAPADADDMANEAAVAPRRA